MCISTGERVTQQGALAHVTRKSDANADVIPRWCSGLVDNPSLPNQVLV
jgi:hypothetical protein